MIYKSLHILPMIICDEILNTGDVRLLSTEPHPMGDLIDLWAKLLEELRQVANPDKSGSIFNVTKEVEYLANKYDIVNNCCASLRFDRNQDLIDVLAEHGYKITEANYLKDIAKAERESKGIENKIKQLQNTLPKQSETKDVTLITDVMAGYSAILNIDFDFNTISVMKFYSLERQVKAKVKAVEKYKPKNGKK